MRDERKLGSGQGGGRVDDAYATSGLDLQVGIDLKGFRLEWIPDRLEKVPRECSQKRLPADIWASGQNL